MTAKFPFQSLSLTCVILASLGLPGNTQQLDPNQNLETPFASENAILDTAIPFAIGAREAQQSLRGSFGWPTFQEGLVEGVYFRFDPDGYARFAPTPRLDTDVFEVICRPRTYSCMGRKGTLSAMLNSRGQLQLKIDDVLSGDRFFVSEGVSEIEVPERILQPLDSQMELLLSTGGDLIVRRGDSEKDRISLTGFFAVSAYLRWVAAHQDYTILPRNWPVPNAKGADDGMTRVSNWQSPMPQPQNFPTAQSGLTAYQAQPLTQQQPMIQPVAQNTTQNDVAEVKGELRILRELLLERNQMSATDANAPSSQPVPAQPFDTGLTTVASMDQPVSNQIAALQQAADRIQNDIARLSNTTVLQDTSLGSVQLTQPKPQPMMPTQTSSNADDKATETAARLHYLMTEIGLDAKTAIMLIQLGDNNSQTENNTSFNSNSANSTLSNSPNPLYQDTVVARILSELERDLVQDVSPMDGVNTRPERMTQNEYQLLSEYFRSVALPAQ